MCAYEPNIQMHLFTEQIPQQQLPMHPQITYQKIPNIQDYLRPGRVWKPFVPTARKILQRTLWGSGKGAIWHSTYYTQLGFWQGKQVVTVYDMIHERFPEIFKSKTADQFRIQKKQAIQDADVILCISEATMKDVQHFYDIDAHKMVVTHLACSELFQVKDSISDALPVIENRPFLLYVGNRSKYKNFHRLLNAYSVWSQRKDIALVIAGAWEWSPDEEQMLIDLKIQYDVYTLSNMSDEILRQLYHQSVAFVYPSLYEGFGIPLLEAMACGCPIVASYIPSTIEVVADIPIYFDPNEVDDLLAALDRVVMEGRVSTRVNRGLEHVKRYSWDKTAQQTLEVYHGFFNA